MKIFAKKTLILSAFTLAAGAANAAAFQLQEVTTSGLGRAYAGEAAIADNAGVVATNPALMTQFKRPEVSVGGIWINPGVNLEGTMYGNASVTIPTAAGPITISNSGSYSANYSDAITSKLLPNAYWIYPVDDNFSVGGGVNVNYGLATEYDADYNAGVMGGKTDLTTVNLNLSGAYRLNNHWSFGLGINAVYAEATLTRRLGGMADTINGLFRKLGNQPYLNATDRVTHLQGDDWGFGWNAGITYDLNENNRWGLAFHSKVKIKFDGTLMNDLPGKAHMPESDGSVTLNLPDYWEFSGYHKVTQNWAVHYSYKLTKWSRLQSLQAYLDNDGRQVFDKVEHFGDTSRFAIGTTYDVNDKLTLRAGIAHDEGAAGRKSSISIPDTDRMWYSLGATYKFTPDLSVDLAYAYVRGKTRSFTEIEHRSIPTDQGLPLTAHAENNVTVRSQVNLYGLNVNYRF